MELSSLVDNLTCSYSGRMFLAVVWCHTYESQNFALNPEVCSWDVTEGTNSEKRKLFIGLNYDDKGRTNRHTHIFLPSERKWVFNWIARNAIPNLYGK